MSRSVRDREAELREIDASLPDRLLRSREAARFLGVKPATLANWRWRGQGPPFVLLGEREVRYRLSVVETWIAERERTSTSDSGGER